MTTEKPVHEIRLARIKVNLWANRSENGARYNATVCRLYRDGDAWKTSESFGRDDLPLVIKALDMAHTWMLTIGAQNSGLRNEGESEGFPYVKNGGTR